MPKEQNTEERVTPVHTTYRLSVGMVLINRFGKIFVARRIDGEVNDWEMLLGGINRGERPRDAMLRELHEVICTDNIEILAESQSWRSCERPGDELVNGVSSSGPRSGWRQKWFLALFTGRDAEIKIAIDNPEFDAWRWVSGEELTALAAPLERQHYLEIFEEFSRPICDAMWLMTATAATGEAIVPSAHPGSASRRRSPG